MGPGPHGTTSFAPSKNSAHIPLDLINIYKIRWWAVFLLRGFDTQKKLLYTLYDPRKCQAISYPMQIHRDAYIAKT